MRIPRSSACLAAWGVLLMGASNAPWQTKDFKDWTAEDADTIMSKSPWAKRMPMPAGGRPSIMVLEHGDSDAPPASGSLGNPSNTTSGTNMAAAGSPGNGRAADPTGTHSLPSSQTPSSTALATDAPHRGMGLTVIWASAKPIRLAVLRQRSASNTPTEEEVNRATRATTDYVLAVVGLPAPEIGADPGTLKSGAYISIKGKEPVMAKSSAYRKIGNLDVYFFHFAKAALPIAASDHQVEFKMTLGRIEVKRRFELNEMQFQGELAL